MQSTIIVRIPNEINIYNENWENDSEFILGEQGQTFVPWTDSMVKFKKMEHIRLNRARILDWFVEVCAIQNQSWQTLWAAMGILDRLIIEKGKIHPSNIHLYGTTALYLASKYHEPERIRLNDIVVRIAHKKFSPIQILDCEAEIFKWVCLLRNDSSLHFPTIEDRVFECFPDVSQNKMKEIMIELFFCMQEPNMIYEEIVDITEKQLVKEVGIAVLENRRYEGCEKIEEYFMEEYGCNNIRRFGYELKF